MKRFFSFLAAATMLFAASCAEDSVGTDNGNEAQVTFNLGLEGQSGTRAIDDPVIGDGTKVNELYYAVFAEGATEPLEAYKCKKVNDVTSFPAQVRLQLAKDQKYTVVFFAQTQGTYTVNENATVTVNYNVNSNIENRDAFFVAEPIEVKGSAQINVLLRRPFAQVNVGVTAADYTAAENSGVSISHSYAKITGVYNTLNLLNGEVSNVINGEVSQDPLTAVFAMAERPNQTLDVELNGTEGIQDAEKFEYLSMNYILVGANKNVSAEFIFKDATNNKEIKFNTGLDVVPVERNHRTNIIGQILTGNLDFNVTIDASFKGSSVLDNYVFTAADLQAALDAAPAGETTIRLGADIKGDVTDIQKAGRKVIIDGGNYKYNGTIKVHSNSNYYDDAALTIKNVNFETSTASINCIEAPENGSERYSSNITVENCTFTATGDAVNTSVGVQVKATRGVTVKNCTATNMHSLIQAQSCDTGDVKVVGCTVNGKNGVAFKQVKSAVVEGTTITAAAYGIRFDGNIDNYGIVVNNNNVTATQPLIVRKMTGKNNTIALEGTNTLTVPTASTATETPAYQIIITNGSDDEAYVKPTGTYTLTGADDFVVYPERPVAKVGNTEYTNIDEAIANWSNNTTLTLLANVTLNNTITLKSTEYHILDLGVYTMTAAKGKDAISITAEGRSSASYALDIKADATNPGGITATSKAIVKTTGKSGVKDRPIIRFYNGVFNANSIINHTDSNGTNCPQFQFHNGIYNGSLSANRALIQIYGGTFNGKFYISVDSSAYALIAGGKFKYLDNLYGSALNSDKFTIGSAKGVFDRGVYVDDEGYIVVSGPVITEFGDKFKAKATNASKAGSYLPYSSANEYGLYYTNAEAAIAKHGESNVILK